MLLRQLEYLVALARERHFARAADACYVSQPSLSAGIRRLEQELRVPIVRRARRYEGLTTEGEVVLAWAHRMLAERDELHQELASLRDGLTGTLRLGVVPTALPAASLLTNPFCERHPHAKVSISSMSTAEIDHGLATFELDAAMTYLDDSPGPGARRRFLYEERYVLLTPLAGPLGTAGSARWSQAAELPLCLLDPRMRNRRIIDACFAADGATATPAVESDSVAGLYAHLPGGHWSSVVSHAWLHMFGVPDGLRVVPLQGPAHGPRVGLLTGPDDPPSVLAGALLAVAREAGVQESLDTLLHTYLT